MSITMTLDLTSGLGSVRDQGMRPTCLAFALSELHRHKHGLASLLSPEFLYRSAAAITAGWKPMAGLPVTSGLTAISGPGQPEEAHCLYQAAEPAEFPPSVPSINGAKMYVSTGSHCGKGVTSTAVQASLLAGRPVGLVLKLTQTFFNPAGNGLIDFSDVLAPTNAVHAVVAAGIGTHAFTKQQYFLIRNSWGISWGLEGNAWIPTQYVQQHGLATFEVH